MYSQGLFFNKFLVHLDVFSVAKNEPGSWQQSSSYHIHSSSPVGVGPEHRRTMDTETGCGLPSTDKKARLLIGAVC